MVKVKTIKAFYDYEHKIHLVGEVFKLTKELAQEFTERGFVESLVKEQKHDTGKANNAAQTKKH